MIKMRTRGARRAISLGLAGLGLAFLATGLPSQLTSAPSAVAATPRNGQCYWIPLGEGTQVLNYDIPAANSACHTSVDWAVNVFFGNGGTVNSVKSALNYWYSDISSNDMFMPGTDRNVSFTDKDNGRKRLACPVPGDQSRHYRVYADSDDYLYTTAHGPFVVATTHWDANECPPIGKRFYGSEEVEKHIASVLESSGYWAVRDWASFSNNEPYRVEGNHTWESNGMVTYISMTK